LIAHDSNAPQAIRNHQFLSWVRQVRQNDFQGQRGHEIHRGGAGGKPEFDRPEKRGVVSRA
jgi:hypothetical protein